MSSRGGWNLQNSYDMIYWFLFSSGELVYDDIDGMRGEILCCEEPPVKIAAKTKLHEIGELKGIPCVACEVDIQQVYEMRLPTTSLRASYGILPFEEYLMAGRASQILTWDANSQFCPRCGVATPQVAAIAKRCPKCHQEFYPRISTAVIVLIKRGEDEILLVNSHNYSGQFYGLVAGFLEVGETLEECVVREVAEETALEIENLRYFGNQPWPYPSGLMVGFVADYNGGEISLQRDELAAGEFFHRDKLPQLPSTLSIARQMIEAWREDKI